MMRTEETSSYANLIQRNELFMVSQQEVCYNRADKYYSQWKTWKAIV